MSNATSNSATNSGSSRYSGSTTSPSSSDLHFNDDIMYSRPFNPSPFELLFMVNTRGHNDALRNMSMGQPHLQFAVDGLIRLQAQHASLNAIIEETNVYLANLAFNATASGPTPLRVEGPITVPSFPVNPERLEFHLRCQLSGLGPLPTDVCDANLNDPVFLQAAETYRARIGAALELSLNQTDLCPHHTRAEPVLPRQYLSWQMDNSTPPSSVSEMPSVPTLTSGLIREHLPTPHPRTTTSPTSVSVWDDENISKTPEEVKHRATIEEVQEFFCALCASWRTTVPETVRATVARSADYLHLGIFLGIAVSDEGQLDFLERTIPGAHTLLTMISMGVTMMTTSMETENSNDIQGSIMEDPDELAPVYVGLPEGEPRQITLPDGRIVIVVRMGPVT
uniref:Uncharacterized protein n=1 Tax=Moniliophthora roreri TaxID=221103 RepID=A0A0W0FR61_MONRR